MIFFVIVLLAIILFSAKTEGINSFNSEYITKDATNSIKGIFVILILLSHAKGYIHLAGIFDTAYIHFRTHVNQMVVAMFLFYSGYGIMEQIKKREFTYIKSIATKRFPNLFLNYDISVLLFALMWLCLGKPKPIKDILIALTAWEGIGNSSWYIFDTLILYIITFISFFAVKKHNKRKHQIIYASVMTGLIIGFIVLLMALRPNETYWFNTIIIYASGIWYSLYKEQIESLLMKSNRNYFTCFLIIVAIYAVTFIFRWKSLIIYEIWGLSFTFGLTLITMKAKIKNRFLEWFGKHVFSIYILQRIPMIVLQYLGVAKFNKYVFVILSIAITCAMAVVFDYLTGKLSGLIWKNKKEIKQAS